MKPLAMLAIAAALAGCASQPTPDWVAGDAREYPAHAYLVGRGQGPSGEEARDRARADLAKIFDAEVTAALLGPLKAQATILHIVSQLPLMFNRPTDPEAISAEPGAFRAEQVAAMQARGHTVNSWERPWGNMQAVLWHRRTGAVEAGSDPRWKGVGKGATSADDAVYR